jgi:hypothetical protein
MSGDWIAAFCAVVACLSALVLAMAKARVAAALAFGLVAAFAGLTAIAAGAFDAGLVLIAAGAMIALMTMAAAAGLGEVAVIAHRPALVPLAACVACAVALLLAWPNAPSAPALAQASRMVAFDIGRGMDVFIALVGFAAVGAGVTALVGFGERGVFGADKDGAS